MSAVLESKTKLTNFRAPPSYTAMGKAISPRGDMLKNRVPLNSKDAPCRHSIPILHIIY
jgi:hypothetical protein